ncbi:hypothetical protein NBEOAGPD_4108 [Methylobacterium gregans]|uniref:Uncharacterized protein n=1 Tax=Methylobacterium gregans TaxID=374424 RepID=A0AA37MC62_9HYPH|nr:hypothetical protein NBEOAGPD_4108 [Methylobacterium gregans]
MITAANTIERLTSPEAQRMLVSLPENPVGGPAVWVGPWPERRRKIASTMITVPSTMSPKSSAPTESRFADSPRATRMMTAKNSAKGIVATTISALRRLPRNSHCTTRISAMPNTILCSTVWVVTAIRSARS